MGTATISINEVKTNPYNSRKDIGDISGLTASIQKQGIFTNFLGRKNDEGEVELAFGARRLLAAKAAGIKQIDVVVKKIPDEDMATLAICENIHRKDLNPIELAKAYQKGLVASKKTIKEFAQAIGVSENKVGSYLQILRLPEILQNKAEELGYTKLNALSQVVDYSKEVLATLDQRVSNENLPSGVLTEIVQGVKIIYKSDLPPTSKQSLATNIILQDYNHLTNSQYKRISENAGSEVQRLAKAIEARNKRYPAKEKVDAKPNDEYVSKDGAKTAIETPAIGIKPIIDYNSELNKVTENLTSLDEKIRQLIEHDAYHNALPYSQKKFQEAAGILVQDIKTVFSKY